MKSLNKNDQHGLAGLGVLLIIVILAILSFVGWFIYHSSHKTKANLDKTVSVSSQQADTKTVKKVAPVPAPTPTPTVKTFTFKEYGVKITLPDSLKDLSYMPKIIDNGDGTKATDLFLNYASLAKDIDACNTTKGSDGNFAALNKSSGQFPADQAYAQVGGLLKQFATFYISASYPNGNACSDTSKEDAVIASMKALQKAMVEAFKTASLVQ